MAPARGLVAQPDFPLYAVQALGSTHFMVAGGGGQAKTGVPNAIEIFELKQKGNAVLASSICRHDTGTDAVMNCASFYDGRNYFLACGQEDKCHIYSAKYKVLTPKKDEVADDKDKGDVKQRKGKAETDGNKSSTGQTTANNTKQLTFDVQCLKSVQTDFDDKDGGFQKVVRFSRNHSFVVTAGVDGFLRVWKFPDMKMEFETKAHKSEIDDLDISPSCDKIVTVSKDHTGCVWDAKKGSKVCNLVNNAADAAEYRYRCCRYGLIEGQKDKYNLYTVSIPVKRSASSPSPCFITMWDKDSFKVKKRVNAGTEVLSAMAVSDDGTYLGVGSLSGSVSVYISFSLQRLYHVKEAHSIFVTGVEFLPASEATRAIVGAQDFNLLSISADNTVHLHQMPERGTINIMWIIIGCFIIIVIMFWLMAEMGI